MRLPRPAHDAVPATHPRQVLAVSFSPNGYHMATGGGDHTCKIWDLRKKQLLHSIPAHSNLLSQVRLPPSPC